MTSDLVLQHQFASPVVLDMIVAALLLQSQAQMVKFTKFYKAVGDIYNYIKGRGGILLIMRVPPSRASVLDSIRKLGFKVLEEKAQTGATSRKKSYVVSMDAKQDQKNRKADAAPIIEEDQHDS